MTVPRDGAFFPGGEAVRCAMMPLMVRARRPRVCQPAISLTFRPASKSALGSQALFENVVMCYSKKKGGKVMGLKRPDNLHASVVDGRSTIRFFLQHHENCTAGVRRKCGLGLYPCCDSG